MNINFTPSRTQSVELTACARCGSQRGVQCIGVRGKPRESVHLERLQNASKILRSKQRSSWAMNAR